MQLKYKFRQLLYATIILSNHNFLKFFGETQIVIIIFFPQNAIEQRKQQVESILPFIHQATEHMMWMNEQEENESARDLSSYLQNPTEYEEDYMVGFDDLIHSFYIISNIYYYLRTISSQ